MRSERRRRLTKAAEGSNSGLATTGRHRELSKVGPIHLCLHRKARPTTRKREDTDFHSRTQASRQADKSRSGCLPRISLFITLSLQQTNGATR